jgi:transposase
MYNAVAAIGYTRKKKEIVATQRDTERVRQLRKVFQELAPKLDVNRLVFIDESGMRRAEIPRYGYAPRGKKAYGKEGYKAGKLITMIGAMATNGLRAFVNIEATTTGEVFREFVIQHLVQSLRPGDCVVMDNLRAHKDRRATEAITGAGASVMFIPPYSPDWNPIEKLWSKVKAIVRRQITGTWDTFNNAVAKAMGMIKTSDILGWIGHCGYAIR